MIASQLIPVQYWETSYIVPPIYWNSDYYVRIFAYYDNTNVIVSGSSNVSVTLRRGQFTDINIQAHQPAVLTSNTAVSVVLLNTIFSGEGGPFMLSVPGKAQFASAPYAFPSFFVQTNNGYDEYYDEYVAVVLRKQFKHDLLYNRRPMRILQEYAVPYPFNQYVVLVAKLDNVTTHTVSMRNNISTPASVFVYGQVPSESYGFLAGIFFNDTGMYYLFLSVFGFYGPVNNEVMSSRSVNSGTLPRQA